MRDRDAQVKTPQVSTFNLKRCLTFRQGLGAVKPEPKSFDKGEGIVTMNTQIFLFGKGA